MSLFGRLVNVVRRVFSGTEREPRAPAPERFSTETDRESEPQSLPPGWELEATFANRGDDPDFYGGGGLPSYMSNISARAIVSFRHRDGHTSYRTLHGPIPNWEVLIELIESIKDDSPL